MKGARRFRDYLQEQLKHPAVRKTYEAEGVFVELAIQIAGTGPSGAHRQPWFFVAISDPALKVRLRERVEEEERDF